jgi:hypothetical protein
MSYSNFRSFGWLKKIRLVASAPLAFMAVGLLMLASAIAGEED